MLQGLRFAHLLLGLGVLLLVMVLACGGRGHTHGRPRRGYLVCGATSG